MKLKLIAGVALIVAAGGLYAAGYLTPRLDADKPQNPTASVSGAAESTAPAVSVVKVATSDFVETVLITGSVVARDEILVAPEVEGLQVMQLLADEGDHVKKDQVLARLRSESLQAQSAQSDANIARAEATIAVARSGIVQAEATAKEANSAYDRAKSLKQSGYLSGATFDQRESAQQLADSKLIASRDSLTSAMADKTALEAQKRDLTWKLGRTEVRAPADGIVSRRTARLGAVATAAGDPMFRIIARGDVELDAEVAESDVGKIREGQQALVAVTGAKEVNGTVRLISGEVDKSTRLGRVRVFFGSNPELRLGAFGRGTIETGRSRGLSAPTSAVVYTPDGAVVQAVVDNKIQSRRVKTGLKTQTAIELIDGITEDQVIVARSGSFLRNGDAVRPVVAEAKVSAGGLQ
jgi:HlyD family secretion protein